MTTKEVVIVKLSSGEVLAANIVEDDTPGILTLENVCRLVEVHAPAESGQANLAMFPFMPYTKAVDRLVVGMQQVVFMAEPVEELAANHTNHFENARNTIVTAKPNLILPENK